MSFVVQYFFEMLVSHVPRVGGLELDRAACLTGAGKGAADMAVAWLALRGGVNRGLQALAALDRAAAAASRGPRAVDAGAAMRAAKRAMRDATTWRVVNLAGIGSREAFEDALGLRGDNDGRLNNLSPRW